jgi:hypothetical protein
VDAAVVGVGLVLEQDEETSACRLPLCETTRYAEPPSMRGRSRMRTKALRRTARGWAPQLQADTPLRRSPGWSRRGRGSCRSEPSSLCSKRSSFRDATTTPMINVTSLAQPCGGPKPAVASPETPPASRENLFHAGDVTPCGCVVRGWSVGGRRLAPHVSSGLTLVSSRARRTNRRGLRPVAWTGTAISRTREPASRGWPSAP